MTDGLNRLDRLLNKETPFRPSSTEEAQARLAEIGDAPSGPAPIKDDADTHTASPFAWTPLETEEAAPADKEAMDREAQERAQQAVLAGFLDAADQLRSASERMRAAEGRASSPDGMIRATVNPHGHLADLRLDATIRRHYTAEQIGPAITAVVQQAERARTEQQAALWSDLYPTATPYPLEGPTASGSETD
ncbi:YbaB/EbfC family nucleoid-associated protein [Spirillospora sp. NPDC048832]